MPGVIVIGEALVDVVESPDGSTDLPGGSPMNVAIGLARLGHDVQLITRIGSDARGDSLRQHIEQSGATLMNGSVVGGKTSTATAVLDGVGAAIYDFDIRWSLDFVDTLPSSPILHTGSIAAFLEPGASDVRRLLAAAGESTVVTFDPNIRPSLLGSPAETLQTVEALASLCSIVKLSDEDAEWLYGDLPLNEVLDRLLACGPGLVIVTRGGNGAILASPTARRVQPGRRVTVADTIGAGDSFMSAIIHGVSELLHAGATVERIADGSAFEAHALTALGEFAVTCAAITVSRSGANPPTLPEARAAL